jgi:Spy/CpxP family protein refolding chaperone
MHRLTKLGLCAGLLLGTTVVLRADDAASPAAAKEPTKQEKAEAKRAAKAEVKELKLVEPWKNITTLSAEQKAQINAIHQKTVDQVAELRAREKVDILALLTDEQKAELKAYEEQRAAERKLKNNKDAKEPAAKSDGAAADEKAGM